MDGWTSTDDNLAMIATATRGMAVDIITNGDPEITRLRGYQELADGLRSIGQNVWIDSCTRRMPEGTRFWITWVYAPIDPGFVEYIENIKGLPAQPIIVDVPFPWRWPEKTNIPEFFTAERIALLDRVITAAAVVTTSYEDLVGPLRELNPNVVHVPDHDRDTEGWHVATLAMMSLAIQVATVR